MIQLRSRSKNASEPAVVDRAAIERLDQQVRNEMYEWFSEVPQERALATVQRFRENNRKMNRKETRALLWELLWFALTLGGMTYNYWYGNDWWVLFLGIAAAHAYVIRKKAWGFVIAQETRADMYEYVKHLYVTKR
jgi:hypothetical protein